MGEDTYRRPTRESPKSFYEGFNRYMLRRTPGKSRFKSYFVGKLPKNLPGKEVMETTYPSVKEREKNEKEKGLVKKLGIVAVAFLGGSSVFVTPNITGNAIWNLSTGNTNSIGVILFVVGLSGMLFCLRKK